MASLLGILGQSPQATVKQTEVGDLPVVFENKLITLSISTTDDTLLLYTDTGGKNYLYPSGLEKLGLKRSRKNLWERSTLGALFKGQGIPIPEVEAIHYIKDKTSPFDGMLGREWFANKVWAFDYVNQTLRHTKGSAETINLEVRLYFKSNEAGHPIHHLPRLHIAVGSDTLSLLFDTGAQVFLSPQAQQKLQTGRIAAIRFIHASTFDAWSRAHPEWTILKGGDTSFGKKHDIIVVPELKIGHRTVGPVAFAKRADANFEVMSTHFMDNAIVGALGGNALAQLQRFTLDYTSERLILDPLP